MSCYHHSAPSELHKSLYTKGYSQAIYYCIGAQVVLKLVKLSLNKMRSTVIILLLLSVLTVAASIAANGDSNCAKAIQSLELTLEKKFEQLKAEIQESCCQGNTTGSGFLVTLFLIFL